MNPILRNVIAVLAGIFAGMVINMGIITLGPILIPYPEGVDVSDMEAINAALPSYEFKHFLVPFFAHALGTLAGAFVTAKIATNTKLQLAMIIGVFFLMGGIMMVRSLSNSPLAFNIVDLVFAYLPMAWIGAKLGDNKQK